VASKLELAPWRRFYIRAFAVVTGITDKLFAAYHPERHYMRGPGPKSLSKIGDGLRERTDRITQEPLPEHWIALMRLLAEQERRARARREQAGSRSPQNVRSV
jgi:hypothetical protein